MSGTDTPETTPAPATSSPTRALLQLAHVSLSFQGVKAVVDVSLEIGAGEICAVIGPNGAGKSSLLNVINGVYHPQEGTITFAGERRRRMQPHAAAARGIGRTFQNIALFRGMTVVENVLTGRTVKRGPAFFAQALGLPSARAEERRQRDKADATIRFLGLGAYRDTCVGDLPYGLQKRVELARALTAEPRLLLLDEPMAGMTFDEKLEMSRFIRHANDVLGTTVVLIEHDMGVVMDLADHVVVLDYGRKIGDGAPDEVRRSRAVIDAYLGVDAESGVGEAA
jgi:branched-chain amino acid transport system ATP-binding protein